MAREEDKVPTSQNDISESTGTELSGIASPTPRSSKGTSMQEGKGQEESLSDYRAHLRSPNRHPDGT